MTPIFVIAGLAGVLLVALWIARERRDLLVSRQAALQTWGQLQHELAVRRELVPYLVGSGGADGAGAVEVLGNACDLAGHAVSLQEIARAEARLTASLRRFFESVDRDPALRDSDRVGSLRQQADGAEKRILFLAGLYNEQASAFNVRLEDSGSWFVGRLSGLAKLDRFDFTATPAPTTRIPAVKPGAKPRRNAPDAQP